MMPRKLTASEQNEANPFKFSYNQNMKFHETLQVTQKCS